MMARVGSLSSIVLAACVLAAYSPGWAPALGTALAATPGARARTAADAAYLASIERWRSERAQALRDPDGWLSFTGSGQLAVGAYSIGSAAGNAIVVPKGPAHWGVLHLSGDGKLRFDVAADSGVLVDGTSSRSAPLRTQLDPGGPTSIRAGRQRFYVVKTGDLYGWRFRDPESPALRAFVGVPHFPVDQAWRIKAQWQPYAVPKPIELLTSNGTTEPAKLPGQAVFERDGKRYTLLPIVQEGEDALLFIIADRTSGRETYGGARFLYVPPPREGTVVLDFNRAQNPPCALNGHVVCPTALPQNRLDLRVTAGEKTYPLTH